MENQFYQKFKDYSDEQLIEILQSGEGQYQQAALKATENILKERGYEIEYQELEGEQFSIITDQVGEYKIEYQKLERDENDTILGGFIKDEGSSNYKPLIVGILLVMFNFIIANGRFQYSISRTGSDLITTYIKDFGPFHYIWVTTVVVILTIYYRQKQKAEKYLWLWVIAGLIFGPWILIFVGFAELMTKYTADGDVVVDDTDTEIEKEGLL